MTLLDQLISETAGLETFHRRVESRLCRRFGQTRANFRLLSAIQGGRTIPQLARSLGITRQSVQRVADRLVERSLAAYEPNPGHRRSPLLKETALGAEVRAALDREIRRSHAVLEEVVEREEIETALLVLRSLRAALGR